MRILTVRQPWAWAIVHGQKDVENRVRNIAGGYRGPVAIHAARAVDRESFIPHLWGQFHDSGQEVFGAIIGVVDLVDVHQGHNTERDPMRAVRSCFIQPGKPYGPCSPWAQPDAHHLVLANPSPLRDPIPFKGALGLRRLDDDMVARIEGGLA